MVLMVRKVIGEIIEDDGTKTRKLQWQEAEGNVCIGSVDEPQNTDIVEFKWSRRNPITGLFV